MATDEDAGKITADNAATSNSAASKDQNETPAAPPAPLKVASPALVPAQFETAAKLGAQFWTAKVDTPAAEQAAAVPPPVIGAARPAPDVTPSTLRLEALFHAAANLGAHYFAVPKFVSLTRSTVMAAVVGVLVGAVGTLGAVLFAEKPAAEQPTETAALAEAVSRINSDIANLKAGIDQSAKAISAQVGKLAERLDRNDKALAEPNAKLAKLGDTLDRVERRIAVPPAPVETTGSIPEPPLPQPSPIREVARAPIVAGWVLRNVYDGTALIESRAGVVEVEPGDQLPGVGRVDAIRRQDGRWVVVTSKGLIVAR